jgi:uncharacterized protein YwqG
VPDFPPEFEWPKVEDRYLVFVAQINLNELPKIDDNPLPSEGILYFFHGRDEPAFNIYHRILHYSGIPEVLQKAQQPDEHHFIEIDNVFYEPYLLEMRLVISTPDVGSDDWDEIKSYYPEDKRGDWVDRYFALQMDELDKFELNWKGVSQVLGYPDQYSTVADVYLAQKFRDGRDFYDRYEPNADEIKKWILLLQLASHHDSEMMWWDAGLLQFLIHADDLKKNDFTWTYACIETS